LFTASCGDRQISNFTIGMFFAIFDEFFVAASGLISDLGSLKSTNFKPAGYSEGKA
jgi:hypothetical protein